MTGNYRENSSGAGFTLVELIIVIVIIAILAGITIVAYTGIQNRAVITSLTIDLEGAAKLLAIDYYTNGTYPATVTAANGGQGLKPTTGNAYSVYNVNTSVNPQTYCLSEVNSNGTSYYITSANNIPTSGGCSGYMSNGTACPAGFIDVPASATFSQAEFCTMKYEAKQVGTTTTPISQASGTPWVSITQTAAIANSPNVAGCTGCHLITESEWLTIAQNVLSVASNWSGGAVGSGYIYSGHNDSAPNNALSADTNDSNGYAGETNTGGNQRRTLTLTNGEIIWDLGGNVSEWTNSTIASGQQPGLSGETAFAYKEYTNGSLLWNGLPLNARPANIYTGAGSWNSAQGIGELYSNYGDTTQRGFSRGGNWGHGSNAGVLALILGNAPATPDTRLGFRVSR